MPRNGSGVYNLPAPTPVPNTTADANNEAANIIDVGQEITNSLARDGQTAPTANLPMGGFRHTGVADGAAQNEYATVSQVQNNKVCYAVSVGGTGDAITLSVSPAPTAYAAGMQVVFKAIATSTGAVTIDVNGLGAKTADLGSANGSPGQIVSGELYIAIYDGTKFRAGSLVATLNGGTINADIFNATGTVYSGFTAQLTNYSISVGGDGNNGDVLKFRELISGSGSDFRLHYRNGNWVWDSANLSAREFLSFSGDATTATFGTSSPIPYIVHADKISIGGRRHFNKSAVPTSGEYARGDIIWNQNASASGTAGWICTTAGIAGSTAVFKTFATISA